ncbi:MAG: hypothetical protein ACLSA6_04425 [Holdemania massiliensis]
MKKKEEQSRRTFDNLIIASQRRKTLATSWPRTKHAYGREILMMYGGMHNVACLLTKSLKNSARNSVIQGGDEQARQLHL